MALQNIRMKNAPYLAAGIRGRPGCRSLMAVRRRGVLAQPSEITGQNTWRQSPGQPQITACHDWENYTILELKIESVDIIVSGMWNQMLS